VVEQGVDGGLIAVDEVDHAGGETGLVQQREDKVLRERDLLGGLDDEGVAGGDGVGQKPEGDHGREVKGADGGEDAERPAHRLFVDLAAGAVLQPIAHHQRGDASRHLDVLDGALDRAARVGQRLAVLRGNGARELLGVAHHQIPQREQVLRAIQRWRIAPGGEGALCRMGRAVDLLRRRHGHARDDRAGGRIGDVEGGG
jgi:hypothetical protein